MHRTFHIPVTASLIVLVGCYRPSTVEAETRLPSKSLSPLIVVGDATHWDAGTVDEGTALSHSVEIQNSSKQVVAISRVVKTCGCTKAQLDRHEIEPNQKAMLELGLDTTGRIGLMTSRVTLIGGPQDDVLVSVNIKARVRRPTVMFAVPSRIDFGEVPSGEQARGFFVLKSQGQTESEMPIIPREPIVGPNGTLLTFGNETSTVAEGLQVQSIDMALLLPSTRPDGLFTDTLTIPAGVAGRDLSTRVLVTATIPPILRLSEPSIFIDKQQLGGTEHRGLVISGLSKASYDQLVVTTDVSWLAATLGEWDTTRRSAQLDVAITAHAKGLSKSLVRLSVAGASVDLPVSYYSE